MPESQKNYRSTNTAASNGTGRLLTSSQKNWAVFFVAIAVVSLTSIAFLGYAGFSEDNVLATLRLSARLAFVILLLVFVARPIHQLFATPFTARWLRRRRLLGVAFAGVHTAHLGQIFYRGYISQDFIFSASDNVQGALVYIVILVMFVTSFDSTSRLLGRRNWKMLHKIGLFTLFVAFVDAVRPSSLDTPVDIYWLFTALALVAVLIRVAAFSLRRQR